MKALVLEARWNPRPDYPITEVEKRTGKVTTGSSVWQYPKIYVAEMDDPRIKPDDVLIRVRAVGVCGSDMHMCETSKDGYMLYPGLTKFPCVLGHEFSGEIVDLGQNVKGLKQGEMVCVEDMIKCGYCDPCRRDFPNQCENLDEIGFSVHGALAEYVAVPAKNCWKANSIFERYGDIEKTYESAATVELTSVSYNALYECAGGFKPGAYAAVYGAGPIGLSAIGLLKAGGASRVIVFEPSEGRQRLAQAIGADFVFDPLDVKPHEVVLELTEGAGADIHVEAAGAPTRTLPEMEKSLAIDGKIVTIGKSSERTSIFLEKFQEKRAKIFSANGNSGYGSYPYVIRLIAGKAFDPTIMITARYRLDEAVEAIENLRSRQDGKIIIKPTGQ